MPNRNENIRKKLIFVADTGMILRMKITSETNDFLGRVEIVLSENGDDIERLRQLRPNIIILGENWTKQSELVDKIILEISNAKLLAATRGALEKVMDKRRIFFFGYLQEEPNSEIDYDLLYSVID